MTGLAWVSQEFNPPGKGKTDGHLCSLFSVLSPVWSDHHLRLGVLGNSAVQGSAPLCVPI